MDIIEIENLIPKENIYKNNKIYVIILVGDFYVY